MRFPVISAIVTALGLSACAEMPASQSVGTPVEATSDSYVFSWAMYAEPVFDRDVLSFTRAYAQAFGAPAAQRSFGFTSGQLEAPEGARVTGALNQLAAAATDGEDLVVVMLTTHGSPDVLALRPDPQGGSIAFDAGSLVGLLAPLQNDRQVIVIQACYSGSLIDDLRAPNRIILTAADDDSPSFGCNPDNDNTFFIRALNQALASGGSWSEIFARTRAIVTQMESERGLPPSNPQSFVGSQMRGLWMGQDS